MCISWLLSNNVVSYIRFVIVMILPFCLTFDCQCNILAYLSLFLYALKFTWSQVPIHGQAASLHGYIRRCWCRLSWHSSASPIAPGYTYWGSPFLRAVELVFYTENGVDFFLCFICPSSHRKKNVIAFTCFFPYVVVRLVLTWI